MSTSNAFKNTETFIDPLSEYGLLRSSSADKTVWLWAKIPWSAPLLDGASDKDRRNANDELASLFDSLSKEVSISGMRYRNLLKDQYRSFHILAGSTPVNFHAKPSMRNTDLGRWQNLMYSGVKTRRQFAYIGVPLRVGGYDETSDKRKPGPLQRFVTTLDRYSFSIANGAPDFEEYLPDAHRVERMMLGAGLKPFSVMDDDEFSENVATMKSWWMSYRQSSALPVIPESDHLHLFPDPESAISAERMYEQGKSCRDWHIYGELPATVCFAQSSRFSRNPITDSNNLWMARLLAVSQAGGGNAIGVSIRGKVEPAEITANEIRRNSQTINDSIRERFEHNREASGDMQDLQERLEYKKSIYQHQDMPPTIVDLSVAALVAGRSRQALDALSSISEITFVNMNTPYEQIMGFKSMCPCSPVTVIPYTLHWSSTVVSGAGVSSFEQGGDDTGAVLGFSEKNRQPILVGTTTVQDEDRRPYLAIVGDTGSGKETPLNQPTPIPPQEHYPTGGVVQFGQLKEGDYIYGRNGNPYRITKLHPLHNTDIYEITLSDGQTFVCGGNHLWTVSSFKDRNRRRKPKHRASVARYERMCQLADKLLAERTNHKTDETMTAQELGKLAKSIIGKEATSNPEGWVRASLDMIGLKPVKEKRDISAESTKKAYKHTQNRKRYDPQEVLTLLINHFDHVATTAKRWREQAAYRAEILRSHLNDKFDRGLSVADILAMFGDGAPGSTQITSLVRTLTPISEWDENVRVMPDRDVEREVNVYNTNTALKALALRLIQRYGEKVPAVGYDEQVLSTKEILAAGLTTKEGQAQWAIHVPEPVQNPEADLPLDPYLFGAWLADGAANGGLMASDPNNGDLDYLRRQFESRNFEVSELKVEHDFYVKGLVTVLKNMGVYKNKHIPEIYFFASEEQRLELVRGLLDQDGTIDANGSIEFTQAAEHFEIIEGITRLLRSLGIKVHKAVCNIAGYTQNGVRYAAQDRYRLTFTTDKPVFSLPRKKAMLPTELRQTQQWLYIKDIRRHEDTPCRCISVDSPDHTYLIGDYVPTHNTMAAFNLMLQWSMIDARDGSGKTPCIFINPKSGNDLEDAVRSQGGVVMRMDSDLADGVFDPFKVMDDVERAKEMATIMIADILDPKGSDVSMELAVASMLDYGVKHGGRCCGVALGLAARAVRDRMAAGGSAADVGLPENTMDVYRKVISAIRTYQSMRLLFGTKNDSLSLRVNNTLTLINAGKRSLIPEQDSGSNVTGRIQQWLLRMTVLGAGTAVQGRDGMVVLDEAWVAMGKGKGTAKTLEEWTRMARSKRFTPVLCTQKVQEFLDSGLTGGISRALLLSLDDPDESDGTPSPARQAMRLLQVDDKNGRMKYRMSQDDTLNNGRPNVNSLKRLKIKDEKTGKETTVRGSVGYWIDGRKPPIPVEIVIPPTLLKQISTTATDVIARQKKQRTLGEKN